MNKPLSEMSWSELIDENVKLQQRNANLAAQLEKCRNAHANGRDMYYGVVEQCQDADLEAVSFCLEAHDGRQN